MPTTAPSTTSARDFLPPRRSLPSLRVAAKSCRGCPLYARATQTVFGEGKPRARLMLVGEQPGDEEDRSGHPFVGPAGRLLDDALKAAGIARSDTYVTNVVKHFKWEARGKRRLHKRPSARETGACKPWLEAEIEALKPQLIVCLGATAAGALLGRNFRVTKQRGVALAGPGAARFLATVHPSSVLRQRTEEDRHREMRQLISDLQVAASLLNGHGVV